ncbi:MAG: permease [Epulopiscium sp.]|nr:permease [Candidatus Epulonipiscium sp.]
MKKITQFIKKNKFLTLILLIYIILFILMPNKAITSLKNSFYYVKEMLMIMPVILLLTALITAWVPKKAIEKNLGSNSGFKGSIFSFLLGSFSAGPIYAAFPVCKTLFEKGASISNIVILLSTWAVVKIPMLLTEFKFLGPKFMIARWILTTISIFIMGYITSKLVKPKDLPLNDPQENYLVEPLRISSEYCIGCGICSEIAPKYFKMENKKATVINQNIYQKDLKAICKAIEKCPSQIIQLHK